MSKEKLPDLQSLKDQLHVLTQENEALAERAEDSLLLGLISEKISNLQTKSDVLSGCLEQISILKDIHYCSCGKLSGCKIEELETYASFSDSKGIGYPMEISSEKLAELQYGPVLIQDIKNLKCNFAGVEFQPECAALIPFKTQNKEKWVFLFLDGEKNNGRLAPMLMLLNHVVELVTAK
ncbi:MAG: hypothetical protein DRQ47_10075, partial [Gammaproteobacteria bacterium]